MKIGGFEVEQELWRTKGSYFQETYPYKPENHEARRKYYIVKSKQGKQYFVKQYFDKAYGGEPLGFPANIEYEYQTTRKLEKSELTSNKGEPWVFNIEVVKVVDYDGKDLLLFDLMPECYAKPFAFSGETWYNDFHDSLSEALRGWAIKYNIRNYDMCDNNTFICLSGKIVNVILIDFEFSNRDTMNENYPLRRNR